MKYKILFTTLLLLAFSPIVAQACPRKVKNPLEYVRRDNNRCEGLTDRRATNYFTLVSFSTGRLSSYPNVLSIRVPSNNNPPPIVTVQSAIKNYLLDDLVIQPTNKGYDFKLSTKILRDADIEPGSLYAIALLQPDSSYIYFPVVLGNPSGKYEFVVEGPQSLSLPTFEVRYKGKTVFKSPKPYPNRTHTLTWNYGKAERGTYELYMVDGRGEKRTFRFVHNPQWL